MKLKQNDANSERRTCGLSGTHTNQPLVDENTEIRRHIAAKEKCVYGDFDAPVSISQANNDKSLEKRGIKYVLDQTARNATSNRAAEVGMYICVCFTTMHRPWNHNGQQSTASRGTRPSLFCCLSVTFSHINIFLLLIG